MQAEPDDHGRGQRPPEARPGRREHECQDDDGDDTRDRRAEAPLRDPRDTRAPAPPAPGALVGDHCARRGARGREPGQRADRQRGKDHEPQAHDQQLLTRHERHGLIGREVGAAEAQPHDRSADQVDEPRTRRDGAEDLAGRRPHLAGGSRGGGGVRRRRRLEPRGGGARVGSRRISGCPRPGRLGCLFLRRARTLDRSTGLRRDRGLSVCRRRRGRVAEGPSSWLLLDDDIVVLPSKASEIALYAGQLLAMPLGALRTIRVTGGSGTWWCKCASPFASGRARSTHGGQDIRRRAASRSH